MNFACWMRHLLLVSGVLATFVAIDLCPEVCGTVALSSGGSVNCILEPAESGDGCCSDGSSGQAMCDGLRTSINFLSFFPCLNDSTFVTVKDCDVFSYAAALLAAEHINSHPSILKFPELGFNTTLRLVEIGTMNQVVLSSFLFSEFLRNVPRGHRTIQAVLGPGSSAITQVNAYIVGRSGYQLHQVSYGATDPSLSNRERYPLLFSTIPSEGFVNLGRLHLLEMFKWSRYGVIFSEDSVHARIAENFVELANTFANTNIAFYGSFLTSPEFAIREMFRLDVKILVGIFGESQARRLLCQAKHYLDGRLTDSNHVWVLPFYYNPEWWKLSNSEIEGLPYGDRCSNDEMEDILSSTLFVDSLNYNSNGTTILYTEKVLSRFYNELLNKTLEIFPSLERNNVVTYLSHSHAASAYDAVRSLALAWNEAILVLFSDTNVCSLETNLEVQNTIREVVNNFLETRSFSGVSNNHQFNISQDSHGQILVSQFISGLRWPIGTFHQNVPNIAGNLQLKFTYLNVTNGLEVFYNSTNSFQWEGRADNTAPSDGVEVILSVIPISYLCVAASFILISMILATSVLILNIALRNKSYMKATSPKLNLIIIVGFIMVMPSSVVLGLSFSRYVYKIPQAAATTVCQLRVWLTNIGCTMAFSTLLAKNWRVYRIFHNAGMRKIHNISDNQLFIVIILLVVPMVIILTVWVVADPLYSQDLAIRGTNTVFNVTFCSSEYHNIWRGSYICYTSLIIVGLMIFSFQNQRVAARFKNSRAAARFVEEGKSTARVTLVSVFIFAVLYAIVFASENDPLQYTTVFWVELCWSLLLPLLLLFVIVFPKSVAVNRERCETEARRQLHQRFSRIRSEMASSDTSQKTKYLKTTESNLIICNSGILNSTAAYKEE